MSFINQLKCDRCNAIEDCDSDKTLKWGSIRAWRGRRTERDGSMTHLGELDVHLCATCVDSFAEWLGEAAKWNSPKLSQRG
jgi:hypothetical protein